MIIVMNVGKDGEKRSSYTLFWGMQIIAAMTENSMEVSQLLKSRTNIWASYPTIEYISKGNEICTFIIGLFSIAIKYMESNKISVH
jgi:hypothetical protein